MNEERDFFDTLRDIWRSFCFNLGSIWTWISIFWKPVAIGAGVLAVLGATAYGAYELAIATPATKLAVTLGAILVYNLVGEIAKRLPHATEEENKKKGIALGCVALFAMPIGVYGLILSVFVLPWFVLVCVGFGLGFAILALMVDEKKLNFKIPRQIFWIRNLLFIFTIVSLGYYLAKFQGWI